MKYLVTGIEGFVGFHMRHLLEESGHEVYGTYFDRKAYNDKFEFGDNDKYLDIRDYEGFIGLISSVEPEAVIHLAAQSSVGVSWENPYLTMDVNVNGTLCLLEAIAKKSPKSRVLLVGSSEEYGLLSKEDLPVGEVQPLNPVNPYGISKAIAEKLGRLHIKAQNSDILFTRSFNHIGAGQSTDFAISDFAKRIAMISMGMTEPSLKVGNLEVARDFTDVRDVVTAYLTLVEKGMRGEAYNVGSGESNKIGDLLNHMVERENLKIDIVPDSERLRPVDNPDICCDNTKMTALGWEPEHDIRDTIGEMIDYYKAQEEKT